MAVVDVSDARVYVSETGSGDWAPIQDATNWNATHGGADVRETFVFDKSSPHVRTGDNTDEYSVQGLYNPGDTNGQNILRTARDNKTTVFIAILHDNTSGAEEGYYQEIRVTQYSDSGDRAGDFVEAGFEGRGVGDKVDLTTGLP